MVAKLEIIDNDFLKESLSGLITVRRKLVVLECIIKKCLTGQVVYNQVSEVIQVLFYCYTSVLEIFRFYDEYDNEYQIFLILSTARA